MRRLLTASVLLAALALTGAAGTDGDACNEPHCDRAVVLAGKWDVACQCWVPDQPARVRTLRP